MVVQLHYISDAWLTTVIDQIGLVQGIPIVSAYGLSRLEMSRICIHVSHFSKSTRGSSTPPVPSTIG